MKDFHNLRHLNILCRALELGSVSRAADALNITQPAASQGLANLERSIGSQLLLRQTGGISATDAGKIFANRTTRALDQLEKGTQRAQKTAGVPRRKNPGLSGKFTAAQLRALIAVGNVGSFTVAANALEVSQPTIHRAAREFEAQCGFPVFNATRGKVEMTPSGALLLQAAKLARSEWRQAGEEIDALRGGGKSTFVLGSLPLARSEIVPNAIGDLLQVSDGLQVQVLEGRYLELLRGLREGDIDCLIGALRQPAPASDVVEESLFHDELAVVCGAHHPLKRAGQIELSATTGFPWIAPPISTPSGKYLASAFALDGKTPSHVRVVSSSLVLVKAMLARGEYLSLISRHQIDKEVRSGEIHVLPVNLEGHTRPIGLTTRRNWHPTRAQTEFTQCLRNASRQAAANIDKSLRL